MSPILCADKMEPLLFSSKFIQALLKPTLALADVHDPVGMGRIMGDGALFFYIQDIIVRPEYQTLGVGRKIVERLMGWLHVHAPERAFVGLFAAEGKDSFYARFGFMRHPALTGMFQVIPRLQEEYE